MGVVHLLDESVQVMVALSTYIRLNIELATCNKFFSLSRDKNEINAWCNLIKRQNGKDGFKVELEFVQNMFLSSEIYRPHGGMKFRPLANAMNNLNVWSYFHGWKMRKAATVKASPRKKCRTPQELVAHNNTGISLTSDEDFYINSTDITQIPSENPTLNELKKSNEDLLPQIKKLEIEQQKNIFTEHVLSSDKNCNHYTAFPKVNVLHAVIEFLDPGSHGENIVLYNRKVPTKSNKRGEESGVLHH